MEKLPLHRELFSFGAETKRKGPLHERPSPKYLQLQPSDQSPESEIRICRMYQNSSISEAKSPSEAATYWSLW